MLIGLTGSIGIGIVWGWLIAMIDRPRSRSILVLIVLSLTVLLEALAIFLLTDLRATIFYLLALIFGLVIRFTWHNSLRLN